MKITIDIAGESEKALKALAFVTGLPLGDVAAIELAGGLARLTKDPREILSLAFDVYCEGRGDRQKVIQRFRDYRASAGIDCPDCEIYAEEALSAGEIEPGQSWILAEAGRIMANPEETLTRGE